MSEVRIRKLQSVQTQNMFDLTIAGNTIGTGGLLISSGTLTLVGGNNITLSQDGGNIMTISGGAGASFDAGVSTGGNTLGTTGTVSNEIVFVGGNNITLSQSSVVGHSATITISAFNQSVQTQNVVDVTLSGNTSGALALVSSGTLTLAGGNNITLSQAGNAVTISGPNIVVQSTQPAVGSLNGSSGTLTIQAGTNITISNNASTISVIGPSNILNSFSIGGNTGTTGSSAISGGGFVIAGGSNITLSQSNATISIHAQSQSAEPRVISLNGSSGSISISGASNITVSNNNSTITVYGPANILNSFSIGGNTGTTGSSAITGGGFVLAGGSNVTLSQSNATITIHVQSQSAEPRVISLNGTSGSLSLSGASNITVSALNGSTITIYGPANILNSLSVSGNTGTTGSSNITGGGFVIAGGSNITLSQSNNSISIHGPSPSAAGIAAIGNIASSNAFTSGSVQFSGLTNITINTSINGASQYIQISAPDPAAAAGVSAIANSETTYTSGLLILSGYSNITISSSVNAGSQYFRLSVVDPGGDAIRAISGSNTSTSASTITFGSSNNMHFYITNGSVVGSFSESTHAHPYVNTSVSSEFIQIWELEGAQTAGTTSSSQGSILYLSGGNMMTLSGNSNTIVFSMNSGSLLGTGATASFQFTSANTKFVQGWELEGVQTAGTTSSSQGTQLYLSGGNMMTLSGNSNTIVFSMNSGSLLGTGATASFQFTSANTKFVQGWELEGVNTVGTTSSSQGTQLYLSGGNMVTLSGNSNTIVISVAGIGGIAGSAASTVVGGTVQFQTGNGITFGLNGSTMTASHNALTSQSTAPSGLYASGIATTFTSGNIGFSGGNNITISTAAQAIIISGANTHAVQIGISSIGATNTTYSSGGVSLYGSGIISLSSTTGQGFVISAAGVISLNGSSSTLTLLAGNNMSISNVAGASQISIINVLSSSAIAQQVSSVSSAGTQTSRYALADHIHAGIGGLGVSNTGTTAGTTGTLAGTWVIAASGNITASQSTGAAGVNTIWLSVPAVSGIRSIGVVGSEQTFTSGNVIFSGQANITLSTSVNGASQYIRISGGAGGAAQAVNMYQPFYPVATISCSANGGDIRVQNIAMPFNITATRADILLRITNASSAGNSIIINIGVYTYAASSASSVSTGRISFSYNSTLAGNSYTNYSGNRYHSFSLNNWQFTPGNYLIAIGVSSTSAGSSGTIFWIGNPANSSILSIDGVGTVVNNISNWGLPGHLTFGATVMPASIHISDVSRLGSGYPVNQPWVMFQGTQ